MLAISMFPADGSYQLIKQRFIYGVAFQSAEEDGQFSRELLIGKQPGWKLAAIYSGETYHFAIVRTVFCDSERLSITVQCCGIPRRRQLPALNFAVIGRVYVDRCRKRPQADSLLGAPVLDKITERFSHYCA